MLLAEAENAYPRDFKRTPQLSAAQAVLLTASALLNANMPLKAVSVRKETLLQGRTP